METPQSIAIIWCDISFQDEYSHHSLKNDINAGTAAAAPVQQLDDISKTIVEEDREQLLSNAAPLFTVRTGEEAMRKIEENEGKKIFVISSGSVGEHLVPEIIEKYPQVHDFYIFTHSIYLHVGLAEAYPEYRIKMFKFATDLLLRLIRDISSYFIKHGEAFLQVDAPQDALEHFNHARNLEIYANKRDKIEKNVDGSGNNTTSIEFRDNLNRLEGSNGLIIRAKARIRELGYSLEAGPME